MVGRDLLASAKAGDPAAFEELVAQTHRRVYSVAYRLVGDRAEAEDVAQEAYLRIFRGLAGFREEARFETWMYRIVANCAVSALRRRGRFGDVVPGEELDQPAPEQIEQQTVDSDELTRALAELPEGQRVVVILKDVYGLSCREIGDELGVEEGAVKVRLHRARRRLADIITGGSDRGGDV
ncbi:MAG: RNA polymerase sigma factor [Actinomycetota bacterium]|nr:RNA polymerase sigma factor [Actinomycetota bacterium]